MRSRRSCPPATRPAETPDHAERVQVVLKQDKSGVYLCRDYLGRHVSKEESPEMCPLSIVGRNCRNCFAKVE